LEKLIRIHLFGNFGNFEFFRENPKGMEGNSLTERLFNIEVEIIKEL
jgi:type I restriction enzyme R subunit